MLTKNSIEKKGTCIRNGMLKMKQKVRARFLSKAIVLTYIT